MKVKNSAWEHLFFLPTSERWTALMALIANNVDGEESYSQPLTEGDRVDFLRFALENAVLESVYGGNVFWVTRDYEEKKKELAQAQ